MIPLVMLVSAVTIVAVAVTTMIGPALTPVVTIVPTLVSIAIIAPMITTIGVRHSHQAAQQRSCNHTRQQAFHLTLLQPALRLRLYYRQASLIAY